MEGPKIILLFSGKRKSGKDYICEKIKSTLGEGTCTIIRISGPLKSLYAENHNLNFQQLLGDGPYKEKYRADMIRWSDEVRRKDPGYFCKAACETADVKPVWIVSDIRRKGDIKWFKDNYEDKIKTVRVSADASVRISRGWLFTLGVDEVESECGLDDYAAWNYEIHNNNSDQSDFDLKDLFSKINEVIC